jgi:hypothetical protein
VQLRYCVCKVVYGAVENARMASRSYHVSMLILAALQGTPAGNTKQMTNPI